MKKRIGILGLSGHSVFLRLPHFHAEGETVTASELFVEPGGKGYNQAVAASRLGAEVVFLTCLGHDSFGVQCMERLRTEGVHALPSYADRPTAFAAILTDDAGRNRVTVYPGASSCLSAQHVRQSRQALEECDCLLLNLECPLEALEAAVEIAEEKNIPIILNPAPTRDVPLELLRKCSLLIPNEQEASILLGLSQRSSSETLVQAVRKKALMPMVITLGSRGALWVSEEGWEAVKACPVKAKDTTGAGDTFCAALTVQLAEHVPMIQALAFATHAAAWSVQHAYVLDGLPRREEIAR